MKVVGVTGTIGSGKTLFCNYLAEMGAFVVHADNLAKDLMASDDSLKKQIATLFGADAYLDDGSLNRSYLAEQAFEKGRAEELNRVVHPVVHSKIRSMIQVSVSVGVPLFVYEAALLLQYGRQDYLDYVIWIQADLNIRLNRVTNRDKLEINEVLKRNERQKQLSQVAGLIDQIIINNGSTEDLHKKAKVVYSKLTVS
jgi:dephospho-CoA kinase